MKTKKEMKDYQQSLENVISVYNSAEDGSFEDVDILNELIVEHREYKKLEDRLGIDLIDFFSLVGKEVYVLDENCYKKTTINRMLIVKNDVIVCFTNELFGGYLSFLNKYWFLEENLVKKKLEELNSNVEN